MIALSPLLYLSLSTTLLSIHPCFMSPMHDDGNQSSERSSSVTDDQSIESADIIYKHEHVLNVSQSQPAHRGEQQQHISSISSSSSSKDSKDSSSGVPTSIFSQPIKEAPSDAREAKLLVNQNATDDTSASEDLKDDHILSHSSSSSNAQPNVFSNQNIIAQGSHPTYPSPPLHNGSPLVVPGGAYHLPNRIATLERRLKSLHSKQYPQGETATSSRSSSKHPIPSLNRPKRSDTFSHMQGFPVLSISDNTLDLSFPFEAYTGQEYSDTKDLSTAKIEALLRERLKKLGILPGSYDLLVDLPFILKSYLQESVGRNDRRDSFSPLDDVIDGSQDRDLGSYDLPDDPHETSWMDQDSGSIGKRGGRIFNYLRQMNGRMKERMPLRTPGRSLSSLRRSRLRHKPESIVRRQPHRQPLPIFTQMGNSKFSSQCAPEKDGSTPMTCPSAKQICLYDVMICDGKSDCPNGEDEMFTLCAMKQMTNKIERRLQVVEARRSLS